MPDQPEDMTWREIGSLARLTFALKLNKVWPWGACVLLLGLTETRRRWRERGF